MAKTTPPADADQAPTDQPAAPAAQSEASPERRYWRYTGPERLYAHIPVTVRDGDVVEYTADAVATEDRVLADPHTLTSAGVTAADVAAHFGEVSGARVEAAPPAYDGHWEPCDGPATVRPDNHPQLVDEVTPDA